MNIHFIKLRQPHFDDVLEHRKTCEIRINDRDYQIDDKVILCEFVNGIITNRKIEVDITHILRCEYIKDGYVCLSIRFIRSYASSNIV